MAKVELNFSCDDCGADVLISPKTITKRKKIFVCELATGEKVDKTVYVSFFCCPSCGKQFVFMLEDYEQIKIFDKRERLIVKANIARGNGVFPEKLSLKINELTRKIQENNEILVKKYNHCTYKTNYFDKNPKELVLFGAEKEKINVKTLQGKGEENDDEV